MRPLARTSGEGGKHGDCGIDDGRVVGPERRDDGVEQVGAVVIRRASTATGRMQGDGVCGRGLRALPDSSKGCRDAVREMRCERCEVRQRVDDSGRVVGVVLGGRKGGCEGV